MRGPQARRLEDHEKEALKKAIRQVAAEGEKVIAAAQKRVEEICGIAVSQPTFTRYWREEVETPPEDKNPAAVPVAALYGKGATCHAVKIDGHVHVKLEAVVNMSQLAELVLWFNDTYYAPAS